MAHGSNGHRFAASAAAFVVVAVAGCATPPPAPPAPVAIVAPPPDQPVATRTATPPRPVDLRWAFTATATACTATASGPGGSLLIQADGSQPLVITARFTSAAHAIPPRARPARLSFSGAAGKWSLAGTWQKSAFSSKQRLDEHSVATILGLLGGGSAMISAGPVHLGTARLPAANSEGAAWVQCPKTLMAGP